MSIKPNIEITDDGTATLRHPVFGDTYHSLHGAVAEAEHVYIQNGLAMVHGPKARILEIGFGSGLNAWLSLLYGADNSLPIEYCALELYPIDIHIAETLDYTDSPLFMSLHTTPWETPQQITPLFKLTKYASDLTAEMQPWTNMDFDIIYFDAFAPDTQPEMWSNEIFTRLYTCLIPGGALVTYSAKGIVKQTLRETGFIVKRLPGVPGKHHMLRAEKHLIQP